MDGESHRFVRVDVLFVDALTKGLFLLATEHSTAVPASINVFTSNGEGGLVACVGVRLVMTQCLSDRHVGQLPSSVTSDGRRRRAVRQRTHWTPVEPVHRWVGLRTVDTGRRRYES